MLNRYPLISLGGGSYLKLRFRHATRIPRDVTQAHKLRGGNDWLTRDFCVKGSLLCTATGCRLTHQQACPLLDAESSAHTGAHPFASCPNRFGAQRLASRKTT